MAALCWAGKSDGGAWARVQPGEHQRMEDLVSEDPSVTRPCLVILREAGAGRKQKVDNKFLSIERKSEL